MVANHKTTCPASRARMLWWSFILAVKGDCCSSRGINLLSGVITFPAQSSSDTVDQESIDGSESSQQVRYKKEISGVSDGFTYSMHYKIMEAMFISVTSIIIAKYLKLISNLLLDASHNMCIRICRIDALISYKSNHLYGTGKMRESHLSSLGQQYRLLEKAQSR
uniref:Uncharacterized protein n=1 Tax=Oryza punctata TaxID=4537 RepID=A0A0E0MC16_ORYPU